MICTWLRRGGVVLALHPITTVVVDRIPREQDSVCSGDDQDAMTVLAPGSGPVIVDLAFLKGYVVPGDVDAGATRSVANPEVP